MNQKPGRKSISRYREHFIFSTDPHPRTATLLLHLTQHPWLRDISHVDEDIISWMTVERCAEPLLIQMVTDEANAAPEDEQTVQGTDLLKVKNIIRHEPI